MDIRLNQTCGACPEQYDALDENGRQVGYLRLRHGYFTVEVPDCGGTVVYEAEPDGDGLFDPGERQRYLDAAVAAIRAHVEPGAEADLEARWAALRAWLEAEEAGWDAAGHGAGTNPRQSLHAGGCASACRRALARMTEMEAQ